MFCLSPLQITTWYRLSLLVKFEYYLLQTVIFYILLFIVGDKMAASGDQSQTSKSSKPDKEIDDELNQLLDGMSN